MRNRLRLEFVRKDYDKIIIKQSKLAFNGIHNSYENCESYLFKKNEFVIDKRIYLGYAVLELSKLLLYET